MRLAGCLRALQNRRILGFEKRDGLNSVATPVNLDLGAQIGDLLGKREAHAFAAGGIDDGKSSFGNTAGKMKRFGCVMADVSVGWRGQVQ